MAIIFPRPINQFAGLLPISSCVWRMARAEEFAGLGSSQSIPIELADPLWAADITIDREKWKDARKTSARLNSLEGSLRDFILFNPLARMPVADPTGAILGGNVVTIHTIGPDFDSVRLTGLPGGYVLTEGDFFDVSWGSDPVRRAPFQLLETVTASGGGLTTLARVTPHIWPGITTGMTVNLIDPAGKFFVSPGSLQMGAIKHALVDGASFTALQRL